MELDPVRVRVMKLIEQAGSNLKTASRAIGKNDAYFHQYVTRATPKVMPEDVREALAMHLGVPPDDLRPDADRKRTARASVTPARFSPQQRERLSVSGYVTIPEIDVRAAAGAGALNDGFEEGNGAWLFSESMIRHELRVRAADLRVITIDGDSMEPLISSGDRILVDTSQCVPVPPGIFVIWDGMGLVVKRVEHVPQSEPPMVIIKSVNPEYQTYERDAEEVKIIGRVIWMARKL